MVTVFTKPACPQCVFTRQKLEDLGVPYRTVDLTTDPAALDLVMKLGYSSAPVVMVDELMHWSGFRPGRLEALAGGVAAA